MALTIDYARAKVMVVVAGVGGLKFSNWEQEQ